LRLLSLSILEQTAKVFSVEQARCHANSIPRRLTNRAIFERLVNFRLRSEHIEKLANLLTYAPIRTEKPGRSAIRKSGDGLQGANLSPAASANLMIYPGGKNRDFRHIINLMPPHRVYIEPFLGSGAVMRNKRAAQINIGVDLLPESITSFREDAEVKCFDGITSSADASAVNLLCGDGIAFLQNYSYQGDELIYLDPPYLMETRRSQKPVYQFEFTEEQHRELLKVIKWLPCMVMISGYASALYKRHLQGWNC
jgi:hypothetical protein